MTSPKINRVEIQGFRAFGRKGQTLTFGSLLAAVWAPNSQGKTSLAEAFEFLLTGQIVRRQLMASTQDEFADALRNAHMPADMPTYVEAEITGADGKPHKVRRTLISDYAKREDCQSALQIDGTDAKESALGALGVVLSQPPLAAPVLAQHTLGYLFSARPQDRATYFKTILEVTDLGELRGAVAALDAKFKPDDDDRHWIRLGATAAIKKAGPFLTPFKTAVPAPADLAAAIEGAITAILTAAGAATPKTAAERLAALKVLLLERRANTFPVDGFARKSPSDWTSPAQGEWDKLDEYLAERERVEEETRRLTALFKEALAIPAVDAATQPVDCLLCGTENSLAPERIGYIRAQVQQTEAFRVAENTAMDALHRLAATARALNPAAAAACPRFLAMCSRERRQKGFRVERIRALLGPDAAAIGLWLRVLRNVARARAAIDATAKALAAEIDSYVENPETLDDPQPLKARFGEAAAAYRGLAALLTPYADAEKALLAQLTAVIDAASDTTNWQDLINVAGDQDALRTSLIERHARATLQKELTAALRQIDKGNERVQEDKYRDLSDGVQHWWDLLRPGEPTFFSAVKPRKGALRTVDFKAGLSLAGDGAPKVRDAITVFSQSQLHCLGLALFIARALHEGDGFMVLDDPILASDEDYRAYFKTAVLEELIGTGVQVIVLTQDEKTWKDLEHRYLHANIDMFQMVLTDPADGTAVTNTGDDLMAMLARAEVLKRGGHPELRKQAGELLRDAAERFCKEILVRDRWTKGEKGAALSDYDGKTLSKLEPNVAPLLTAGSSHPGKLHSIRTQLNPAKHDSDTPDKGTISVALGDLKFLKEQYLHA